MSVDVDFLPPRCPDCNDPMQLVSVVCSRAHVLPPVSTFECAECETDAILQWRPTQTRRAVAPLIQGRPVAGRYGAR
jgi:hypothetical protein